MPEMQISEVVKPTVQEPPALDISKQTITKREAAVEVIKEIDKETMLAFGIIGVSVISFVAEFFLPFFGSATIMVIAFFAGFFYYKRYIITPRKYLISKYGL